MARYPNYPPKAAAPKAEVCVHCGEEAESGLEDLKGRPQCPPCEEDIFDAWFDRS